MRGIACDENAAAAIAVSSRDPEIPEADVVELDVELRANG